MRNAYEQLRVSHIETLEILQRTVDENNSLKEKIQALSEDETQKQRSFRDGEHNISSFLGENEFIMKMLQDKDEEIQKLKDSLQSEISNAKTYKIVSTKRMKVSY